MLRERIADSDPFHRLPRESGEPGRATEYCNPGFPLFAPAGIIDHALEIDHDRRLVADHPGIMTRRQQRNVARLAIELRTVIHLDAQHAGDVILKVRRLAALGVRERLERAHPAPTRLEHGATDHGAADLDELEPTVGELAHLVRFPKGLVLGSLASLAQQRIRHENLRLSMRRA